ncbi:MAG: Ribosome bioproteinsis protein brx1 [Alectoria sarmentosa]|nr:MAG: Ribosome bioproteinsis protein brx1 [Alectoria sarmentosa]
MAAVYKSLSKSSPPKAPTSNGVPKKNKQRVLILSSRGVTYQHRHLLNDLYSLLPHSRKDAKLDTKTKLYQLNELAELYNCNNILFFEARKVHTMSELHFPGNCLKGSRPILSFDATFSSQPHLLLIKELLTHIFGVPQGARKTKPFVDHVMGFTIADGKIWIRCFQISETAISKMDTAKENGMDDGAARSKVSKKPVDTKISLVEIGPRFVLTPIVILESSFGGPVIYENKEFVSPNQIRSELRLSKAGRYNRRSEQALENRNKRGDMGLRTGVGEREKDELDESVLFA